MLRAFRESKQTFPLEAIEAFNQTFRGSQESFSAKSFCAETLKKLNPEAYDLNALSTLFTLIETFSLTERSFFFLNDKVCFSDNYKVVSSSQNINFEYRNTLEGCVL